MACSDVTFSFTVRKFSNLKFGASSASRLVRDECLVRGTPSLRCLIKVNRNRTSPDYFSYFIQCYSGTTFRKWSYRASLELRIKSFKEEDCVRKCSHLFTASEHDCGYTEYKSWVDLINPENGFINNDQVTFEVKISAESPLEALEASIVQV